MSSTTTSLHGVFLDIFDQGVLLTGPSRIGKSELALALIQRGHRLIADDSVNFSKTHDDRLLGTCPLLLQDFLEIQGLGIINIKRIYGETAICKCKHLQLIISLKLPSNNVLNIDNYLHGKQSEQFILGTLIPERTIFIHSNRNLVSLVEIIAQDQKLKLAGYDASTEFVKRQQQQLLGNEYL